MRAFVLLLLRVRTSPLETTILFKEKRGFYLNSLLGTRQLTFHSSLMGSIVFFRMLVLGVLGLFPYFVGLLLSWKVVFFLGSVCWIRAVMNLIITRRLSLNFVKKGHPAILRALLLLIELISELIKPFSLRIRLYANLTFGYYVLLSTWMLKDNRSCLFYGLAAFMVLFEFAVILVQRYIFSFLVSMYYGE